MYKSLYRVWPDAYIYLELTMIAVVKIIKWIDDSVTQWYSQRYSVNEQRIARAYRRHEILLTAVLNFPMTTFLEIHLQNYFKAYSFGIVVVVYMFGCVIISRVVKFCCVTLDIPRWEHWLQYILGLNFSTITTHAMAVYTWQGSHVQCHFWLCCVL